MILNGCYNVKVVCNRLVSGIEYFKCKNITQDIGENNKINSLDIYDTTITLNIRNIEEMPKIFKEKSEITINKL